MTALNTRSLVVALLSLFALAGCAETEFLIHTAKSVGPGKGPAPVGDYKVGNPYKVNGRWYYPKEDFEYVETGIASWYGPQFHGKRTANGEIFDQNQVTAAHPTLPLPSAVRVTNLENGRSIMLRINDRGPFARGRIIDLSRRAAQLLGFEKNGTAKVRVEILANESRQLKLAALDREGARLDQPQIASSPRESVVATPLPGSGQPVQQASTVGAAPPPPRGAAPIPVLPPEVEVVPVAPTRIFVQTGAFSNFENALRMRDRMYPMGPTQISRIFAGGLELYRVRIGPLRDVEAADATLQRVAQAGVDGAQLIVE